MLPAAPDEWTIFEAAHLLRRAGFGGSPDEIKVFHALGRKKAVDALLAPDEALDAFPLPEWASREVAAEEMRERAMEVREMRQRTRDMTPEQADRTRRQFNQQRQRESRQRSAEAQGWWFERMLKTKAPLREKMVLFWHDHFATSFQKVRLPVLLIQQNELFRRYATGSFKDLTHEIVKDAAMMLYLDTQSSKKGKPNENFAREVMELFTLGEGNYTEQDIKEAARAFTGYQINRGNGAVTHNRRQADNGEKTIFSRKGKYDGDGVVDLIFEQSAASRLIPTKLWEYFVAENPPKEGIDALAKSFKDADFKIEPLLREIFLSKSFYAEKVMRDQIKSPIQYLVQMFKELELREAPEAYVLSAQQQLGQVLFMPPNVAGWDWGKAWINTNTLLSRYNVAGFITKGSQENEPVRNDGDGDGMMMEMEERKPARLGNAMKRAERNWAGPDYEKVAPRALREDPEKLIDSLLFRFFQSPLGPKEREAFVEYARSKKGAVFTNKETGELCHLILSTPQYQLA
ncbi:DUF1800 domain-containing protein [Luteolibacter sp. GHJ8]|uniref:DUF1800 domain-containing protein n=1 Tax=Luteolibacter rhizosphaerae TaxID=2989719 RepID=A0ABT3G3K1_9BACT|nr:DUF1800 domain-containing protein [Luteolibacter rhizosphaerae]MCW1914425.1 DUF1800 domain-containing protein [Luteolibacter rhizosphaerae]